MSSSESTEVPVIDTICYKYNFHQGDTLIYILNASDSISIDYDTPILKFRNERIRITCDSVSSKKHFFLSISLISYDGKEVSGDTNLITRQGSPMLNRTVQIEIDSVGRRYSYNLDKPDLAAISPGGPFDPVLLYNFGESCKLTKQSWMVLDSFALPENGIPFPVVRYSSLFRAIEKFDTLGEVCHRLEYINTGQGNFKIDSKDMKMTVTSVLNGYGSMVFSKTWSIVIKMFGTVEQKLKITGDDGIEKPGWHYVMLYYTLEKYIPAKIKNNNKLKSKDIRR